jgi:hypothetical protein
MPDDTAIVVATAWLQALLLGSAAVAAAWLVFAACVLGILTGRLNRRAGLRLALGVALVFGAARMSSGMLAAAEVGPAKPDGVVLSLAANQSR